MITSPLKRVPKISGIKPYTQHTLLYYSVKVKHTLDPFAFNCLLLLLPLIRFVLSRFANEVRSVALRIQLINMATDKTFSKFLPAESMRSFGIPAFGWNICLYFAYSDNEIANGAK